MPCDLVVVTELTSVVEDIEAEFRDNTDLTESRTLLSTLGPQALEDWAEFSAQPDHVGHKTLRFSPVLSRLFNRELFYLDWCSRERLRFVPCTRGLGPAAISRHSDEGASLQTIDSRHPTTPLCRH